MQAKYYFVEYASFSISNDKFIAFYVTLLDDYHKCLLLLLLTAFSPLLKRSHVCCNYCRYNSEERKFFVNIGRK